MTPSISRVNSFRSFKLHPDAEHQTVEAAWLLGINDLVYYY